MKGPSREAVQLAISILFKSLNDNNELELETLVIMSTCVLFAMLNPRYIGNILRR